MGATPARLALTLYSLAVVALCALSSQRPTGDASEYVAVAQRLAHLQGPSFPASVPGAQQPMPVDRYGRRQPWHFWFFPALAVPFLWLAPSKPVLAFTCVNVALLISAFACVRRRLGLAAAAFVCAGPILWWIDKAQVEVFTVSLLAVGCASLERRERAALAFAVASTQNPPIAIGAALLALERIVRDPRSLLVESGWWLATLALCVLNPLFYLWRLGRLTPLVAANDVRLPGTHTMLAVVSDSNIGLLPNAPVAALMLAVVFALAAGSAASRRRLMFAAVLGAAFLTAFAQAPNVNSGGTPDMSRYALWLLPLAIVLWPRAPSPAIGIAVRALVCASVVWAAVFFRPSVAEHYLSPTRLAMWLWTNHPSWENPLPEVFAERLRHQDGVNPLAATPDCGKVLIQEGHWAAGCAPARAPAACVESEALCYANRRSDGRYAFVLTSRRGGILLR